MKPPGYYQIRPVSMSQIGNGRIEMILPFRRFVCSVVVLYGSATRDQLQHQNHQRHNEKKVNQASDSTDEAKCPKYEQNYQKCPKHELFSNLFLIVAVRHFAMSPLAFFVTQRYSTFVLLRDNRSSRVYSAMIDTMIDGHNLPLYIARWLR
jgi:hypothetical protein